MRIHERLLDRLYPIWPTDRFGPPPVVELILPARSPLRDDQPHFDMFIRVHRRYFRIISFGFEMCDNGRLILTYLPDMTELRTLHLEGANALLPLSNPADERIIDPVWASSSGLPGRLDLPPRLEELRIVTVGIPLASSGWTLTGSLVRLDLECAVRPVRGTGNQLDLVSCSLITQNCTLFSIDTDLTLLLGDPYKPKRDPPRPPIDSMPC